MVLHLISTILQQTQVCGSPLKRGKSPLVPKLILKLGISAILIWVLVRSFDAESLLQHLAHVSIQGPILAVLILFALSLVQAWRWTFVFRAFRRRVALRKCWEIVLIGLFFNQTLPSSVGGDAARIWRIYRAGFDLALAAHSVILDRLAALVALLLLAAAGLPMILELVSGQAPGWPIVAIIMLGLAGWAALLMFDRLPEGLRRWRITRAAALLSADARRLFLHPRCALPVLLISACIHVVVALVVFLLARAMNIQVDAMTCVVLVPPVILVSMIPITIAGWGVREGAMVTAFGFVGVAPDQAFVLSVVFGLVVMAVGLPGGAVWLATGRREARAGGLSELAAGVLKPRGDRPG